MKKLLLLMLVGLLSVGLAACGADSSEGSDTNKDEKMTAKKRRSLRKKRAGKNLL